MEANIHPQVYLQINDYLQRTSVTDDSNGSLLVLCGTRDGNREITIFQAVDILLNVKDIEMPIIDTAYLLNKIRLLASSNGNLDPKVLGLVVFRQIDDVLNKNELHIVLQVRQHVDSDTVFVLSYSATSCTSSLYSYDDGCGLLSIPVINTSGPTEFASISTILNSNLSLGEKKKGADALFNINELSQELCQKRESLLLLNDEKLQSLEQLLTDLETKKELEKSDFEKLQKLGNLVELLTNIGFSRKDDDTCLDALMGLMQLNLVGNGHEGSVLRLLDANKKLLRKL